MKARLYTWAGNLVSIQNDYDCTPARARIAQTLTTKLEEVYHDAKQQVLDEQFSKMVGTLTNRINEIVRVAQDKQHQINQAACMSLEQVQKKPGTCSPDYSWWQNYASYDATTAVCTLDRNHWTKRAGSPCSGWDEDIVHEIKTFQLPVVHQSDLRTKDGKGNVDLTTPIKTRTEIEENLKHVKR